VCVTFSYNGKEREVTEGNHRFPSVRLPAEVAAEWQPRPEPSGERRYYCGVMPTSFTTFAHFSRSLRMNAANFSGLSGVGWKP